MIAITGAKIITMDEAGYIENASVIVDNGIIRAVGQGIDIPAGCDIIDGTDRYVVPGFIDAHTHIGLEEEIYGVEGDDVNEMTDPITPQLQAVDGINFWDLAFQDALKGGVTRSMCMPGSANILGGQAVFLKHLSERPGDMVYKNPWGLKAALGENPKRVYSARDKSPATRMASASLLKQALYTAADIMTKEDEKVAYRYKYAPVIKVLKKEMPLLLHAHRADDILTALRIKKEFDINLIIQHGTEAVKVADELVEAGVPVFLGPLFCNRAKVEMKELSFKNAALLNRAGVKFSFISDHPVIPVEHLRVCAAIAVREGLDEETALKALTLLPAEMLGVSDELGSITIGKKADLLLVHGHPLDFRSNIEQVLVDGKVWGGNFE